MALVGADLTPKASRALTKLLLAFPACASICCQYFLDSWTMSSWVMPGEGGADTASLELSEEKGREGVCEVRVPPQAQGGAPLPS